MSEFQQTHRKRQVDLLTRQLELEKKLAGLVEDAYALTPEERSLLRSSGLCETRLTFWRQRFEAESKKAV